MGFTDEEFPNVLGSWISRIHPDEVQSLLQRIIDLCKPHRNSKSISLAPKKRRDMWINGRGQAILDIPGPDHPHRGNIRDITENRRVAEALQASEAKWRSLVNTPDIITVVEPDGTIQFMNRGWPGLPMPTRLKNLILFRPRKARDRFAPPCKASRGTGH